MCHDDDSRPPAPPNPGVVGSHGPLTLTAQDGTEFAAYEAYPARDTGVGFVILPDVRGLHPYYPALAQRFAEAGFGAVAIDYFGRTAGMGPRDEGFEYRPHVEKVTQQTVLQDAGAAVAHLRGRGSHSVFSVGFCFGGGHSWRLAASDLGLAGAVGFYGMPRAVRDVVDDVRAPILMLVAGADRATGREEFEDLDRALADGDHPHQMHVYEGAPHSFFDRGFAQWREACEDAWHRVIAFAERHSTGY